MKQIELLAGRTQTDVLNRECDFSQAFDSIKEAKRKLEFIPNGNGTKERYLFSRSYQQIVEASEPLQYAQILIDGECVYDYFAKGYNGESKDDE
jgi:hypothetical protein